MFDVVDRRRGDRGVSGDGVAPGHVQPDRLGGCRPESSRRLEPILEAGGRVPVRVGLVSPGDAVWSTNTQSEPATAAARPRRMPQRRPLRRVASARRRSVRVVLRVRPDRVGLAAGIAWPHTHCRGRATSAENHGNENSSHCCRCISVSGNVGFGHLVTLGE